MGWGRFLILLIGNSIPTPTIPIDVIWEGFIVEKVGVKTRDIQFYSEKGGIIIKVHSKQARDYAKWLEGETWVESYEAACRWDMTRYPHIDRIGIRPAYFETEWASDFLLRYADGRVGVRELVTDGQLQKKADLEKLELSRRYWAVLDVSDWKVVVIP